MKLQVHFTLMQSFIKNEKICYESNIICATQQLIKMWLFGSIQSINKSFDALERIQTKVLAQNLPDTLPKICYKDCTYLRKTGGGQSPEKAFLNIQTLLWPISKQPNSPSRFRTLFTNKIQQESFGQVCKSCKATTTTSSRFSYKTILAYGGPHFGTLRE